MRSLLSELRKILRKNGYKKTRAPVGLFNGMRASIYGGHRHIAVVIEEVVFPCSTQIGAGTAPQPVKGALTEVFRRLRKFLTGLGANLRQTTLVLPGGGKLPIPKSFRDWATKKGLQIAVVSDTVPRELARKINDNKLRQTIPQPFVGVIDEL